jgi:hypothetical protein
VAPNLGVAAEVFPSLCLEGLAKNKLVDQLLPAGDAEGSRLFAEGSLESGDLDSQVTDPVASWVDDNQ